MALEESQTTKASQPTQTMSRWDKNCATPGIMSVHFLASRKHQSFLCLSGSEHLVERKTAYFFSDFLTEFFLDFFSPNFLSCIGVVLFPDVYPQTVFHEMICFDLSEEEMKLLIRNFSISLRFRYKFANIVLFPHG